ncbi:MAG: hypothetical protein K2W82_09590 [Candidatus Obscuribacterales bacterium]|nr:hypothetical protein [Candidatus Obscuribacterales bacterium]
MYRPYLLIALLNFLPLQCFAEECDNIAEILRKSEFQHSMPAKLSNQALQKIALLAKEVEAKRNNYARALDLYLGHIGADKAVDQARIDYEKAQINLAAYWNSTKQVLPILRQQEKSAQAWKQKYHCGGASEL